MLSQCPSQGHVCLLSLCLLVAMKDNGCENIFKKAVTILSLVLLCVRICLVLQGLKSAPTVDYSASSQKVGV